LMRSSRISSRSARSWVESAIRPSHQGPNRSLGEALEQLQIAAITVRSTDSANSRGTRQYRGRSTLTTRLMSQRAPRSRFFRIPLGRSSGRFCPRSIHAPVGQRRDLALCRDRDLWSAKKSVTRRRARANIRDAGRQGLTWRRRHTNLRSDGANWVGIGRDRWAGGSGIPDPAPCEDARRCNGESTFSEWSADAIRIAESTNPDTRAESCR